jgi:hypothetical protein
MGNYVSKPDNNMIWAILSTIFCCLPLGIVAIINAAKVDGLYRSGDHAAAREAAENAKKYSLFGFIFGLIGSVIYFILGFAGAL